MSKHICSKNKRNEKEASCILHWHGPNRYKNGKIYILGSSKKLPGLGGYWLGKTPSGRALTQPIPMKK